MFLLYLFLELKEIIKNLLEFKHLNLLYQNIIMVKKNKLLKKYNLWIFQINFFLIFFKQITKKENLLLIYL